MRGKEMYYAEPQHADAHVPPTLLIYLLFKIGEFHYEHVMYPWSVHDVAEADKSLTCLQVHDLYPANQDYVLSLPITTRNIFLRVSLLSR